MVETTEEVADEAMGEPAAEASDDAAAAAGQWPLFYKQPVPLSVERHGAKSIRTQRSFEFASDTNMVPINLQEFARVATAYPVVFTEGETANAIAVLGLRQGQNLFVNEEGAWDGGVYVPAYVRRYPFIFSAGQSEEQLVLCVDEGSDVMVDGGDEEGLEPVYDGEEATDVIKRMLEFCAAFHRQSLATREFIAEMEQRELFRPGTVTITNDSGEQFNLRGFRVIDESKFSTLPDDVYLEYRRKGWIAAIISHLVSVQNLAALGFRSKQADDS